MLPINQFLKQTTNDKLLTFTQKSFIKSTDKLNIFKLYIDLSKLTRQL